MATIFSLGLRYFIAIGVVLSLLMFFLVENGRVNSFSTYLLALAVLTAIAFPSTRTWLHKLSREQLLITAFLLQYLALSAWWSEMGSFQLALKFQGYAILIFSFILGLSIAVRHYDQFLLILCALTLAAAAVSASFSLYLHFSLPDYRPLPEPRLYALGRLSNPVISAASYGFAAILGVWLFFQQRFLLRRVVLVAVLSLLFLAILSSGTRTVWLALAVGIGIGIACHRGRFLISFLSVFIFFGLLGSLSIGWDDFLRRGLSFRPEIWAEFVGRSLADHPFFGAGSGTDSHWQTPELLVRHPHSIFVSLFFFGGVVGVGLFLALLYSCIRLLQRAPAGEARTLSAMLLSYGIVFGIFDGDNILTKIDFLWWLVWMPIGICLSLNIQINNTCSSDHAKPG